MNRFKTIAVTNLHTGIVELSRAQAVVRERSLRNLEGDFYEITGPIQFKVGEEIGFDGEVNKRLLEEIRPVDEIKEEVVPQPKEVEPEVTPKKRPEAHDPKRRHRG